MGIGPRSLAAVAAAMLLACSLPAGQAFAADPAPPSDAAVGAEQIVTVACVTDSAEVVSVDVPASEASAAIRTLPLEHPCDVAAIDTTVHLAASNDPNRSQQYALNNVTFEDAWGADNGTGVTVAVIDTGVQSNHPDLAGQILTGRDYTTGVGVDGTSTDPNGHGTHVSGILAAVANNTIGVTGAAPGVKILPVRVLDASGSGDAANVAAGIQWAVSQGADVINMSLGGTQANAVLEAAVSAALNAGVVVVAAAGNNGDSVPFYPASYPGVVAVAATTSSNVRASYSNTGNQISVSAPGDLIVSTFMGSTYAVESGTSMASPYAAAEAALIVQANPTWTPAQVKSQMESTATDLSTSGFDTTTGWGLINPSKALCSGLCTPAPTITNVSPNRGPLAAGTSLTITGSGFNSASSATIGGTSVPIAISSPTFLTAIAPAHAAGPVTITVTNPSGTGTAPSAFTYLAAPGVTTVAPLTGAAAGGTTITLTGVGFAAGATTVTVGGAAATSVNVLSATQLTAVTPAHAAGLVDVAVATPGGAGALVGAFTYDAPPPPPAAGGGGGGASSSGGSASGGAAAGGGGGSGSSAEVLEVRPAFGPVTGGTRILILGYGFWGANAVTIGGVPATDFRYIDAATVEVTTPPGVEGWQPVAVTLAVGRATAAFKYERATAVGSGTPPPATPVVSTPVQAVAPALAAPTGVSAKARQGVVTVTWRQSDANAGRRAQVTVLGNGKTVKKVTAARGATRVTVRGLKKGVRYTFRVSVTANGRSLSSVASAPIRLIG